MKSVILLVLIFVNTSLVMAVPETNKVMRLVGRKALGIARGTV